MQSFRAHDAEFSAYAIGEAMHTLTDSELPTHMVKQKKQYQQSALLPALPRDAWPLVNANFQCGIHHFKNATVLCVNEHTVSIGARQYGGAYEDKYGKDKFGDEGPFLNWSGQMGQGADAALHQPCLAPDREIHLMLRCESATPFYYWGKLLYPFLVSDKDTVPPRVRYEIAGYERLQAMGFPGSKLGDWWRGRARQAGKRPRGSHQTREAESSQHDEVVCKREPEEETALTTAAARKRPMPHARPSASSRSGAQDGLVAKDSSSSGNGAGTSGSAIASNSSSAAGERSVTTMSRTSSRSRLPELATVAVADRVEGRYAAGERLTGWWPATVTRVHAADRHGDPITVDLAYDDGDKGARVPLIPEFVRRLAPWVELATSKPPHGPNSEISRTDRPAEAVRHNINEEALLPATAASPDAEPAPLPNQAPAPALPPPPPPPLPPPPSALRSLAPSSPARAPGECASTAGGSCVVCMDGAKDQLFLPCKHICCCAGCADKVVRSTRTCPMCRASVDQVIDGVRIA